MNKTNVVVATAAAVAIFILGGVCGVFGSWFYNKDYKYTDKDMGIRANAVDKKARLEEIAKANAECNKMRLEEEARTNAAVENARLEERDQADKDLLAYDRRSVNYIHKFVRLESTPIHSAEFSSIERIRAGKPIQVYPFGTDSKIIPNLNPRLALKGASSLPQGS